jgi:hypothetical protein
MSNIIDKNGKGPKVSVEHLLNKLTHKELYDFTLRLIKNNPDLTNAVFLEFSERIENKSGNKYISHHTQGTGRPRI